MDTIADDSIDAVLLVLMLTVFADRKAWDEELDVLRTSLPKLAIFTDGGFDIPPGGLDKMLIRHTARVRALMDETDLNGAIDTALRRISNPMLTPMVLSAMHEIAGSDANIHIAETNLIERAEAIWNGTA